MSPPATDPKHPDSEKYAARDSGDHYANLKEGITNSTQPANL
jgi:hypothetical protein